MFSKRMEKKTCPSVSVLDAHTAHEVAGGDVEPFCTGCLVGDGVVVDTSEEAVVVDKDLHVGRDKQLHSAHKGVYLNLRIVVDERLTEIHADSSAEGLQFRAMERLAIIAVGVT